MWLSIPRIVFYDLSATDLCFLPLALILVNFKCNVSTTMHYNIGILNRINWDTCIQTTENLTEYKKFNIMSLIFTLAPRSRIVIHRQVAVFSHLRLEISCIHIICRKCCKNCIKVPVKGLPCLE